MSMTIGRASLSTNPLNNSIKIDGDVLSFAASVGAASVDECKARIQQLSGLVDNPDESVIPFTCSGDSSFDGFYRILNLNIDPLDRYVTLGQCRFSITMERVPYYARPYFETILQQTLRSNGHAVTGPVGIAYAFYSPSGVYESNAAAQIGPVSEGTVTNEDGTVSWGTNYTGLGVMTWNQFVQAADFYKARAKVEIKYGSTWYPIHGRQVPYGIGLNWRLSNGYVRVYPTQNGSNYYFKVETYRSGNWVGQEYTTANYSGGVFGFFHNSTGTASGAGDPTVMVNTPELVSVSVPAVGPSAVNNQSTVFSLRSGDTWVEVQTTEGNTFGVVRTTNEAGTSFTGGVRATANDANGLRYLITTATVSSADTTKGGLISGGIKAFAIYAVAPDYLAGIKTTPTDVRDLFYAVRSERRSVVAR